MIPFYWQWIEAHQAYPTECWTDAGYDPTRSKFSRDVQLLVAMEFGKMDIDNGGFHQFFWNSTGVYAPEMLEWCERNDLSDVAEILRQAMDFFGEDYPRSRDVRIAKLPAFERRDGWNPFDPLDEKFYAALSNNRNRFEIAAERWLREVCKVQAAQDVELGRRR